MCSPLRLPISSQDKLPANFLRFLLVPRITCTFVLLLKLFSALLRLRIFRSVLLSVLFNFQAAVLPELLARPVKLYYYITHPRLCQEVFSWHLRFFIAAWYNFYCFFSFSTAFLFYHIPVILSRTFLCGSAIIIEDSFVILQHFPEIVKKKLHFYSFFSKYLFSFPFLFLLIGNLLSFVRTPCKVQEKMLK